MWAEVDDGTTAPRGVRAFGLVDSESRPQARAVIPTRETGGTPLGAARLALAQLLMQRRPASTPLFNREHSRLCRGLGSTGEVLAPENRAPTPVERSSRARHRLNRVEPMPIVSTWPGARLRGGAPPVPC